MPKVMGASKITSKFQVTVPEEVREILKVQVGDHVVFVRENGKVFITAQVALE